MDCYIKQDLAHVFVITLLSSVKRLQLVSPTMKMKLELIFSLVCVLVAADCKQAVNRNNSGSWSASGKVLCLNFIRAIS